MRLENKIALVTGSSSGIGRETAVLFAHEGASVIVLDINEEGVAKTVQRIKEETGRDALAMPCDISSETSVSEMAETVKAKFGALNILVNCAGIQALGSILETSTEEWDRVFTVNVRGMFLVCKYLVPLMPKGGSIVNVGSTASVRGFKRLAAYSSSKGAVMQLTNSMAVDLAPGLRVNCICPGSTRSDMTETQIANDPEWLPSRLPKLLVGRMGYPIEIARAILFLASDEASFVNGANYLVDGGITCH